jgi:hypothetical protein
MLVVLSAIASMAMLTLYRTGMFLLVVLVVFPALER